MKSRIIFLIKIFDKEEYADAFIEKGEMFCRTLGEFKKIDDSFRGDEYEAVTHWHQPDKVSLTAFIKDENGNEKSIPIEGIVSPVVMQNNAYNALNLYCMYKIDIEEFEENYDTLEEKNRIFENINNILKQKFLLSKEALSLGEFAVIITNVEEFIKRVKKVSSNESYSCISNSVRYFDPETFSGVFDNIEAIFRKRNIYQHQNEYRFVFTTPTSTDNKIFYLGSLKDIATKTPTAKIQEWQLKLIDKN